MLPEGAKKQETQRLSERIESSSLSKTDECAEPEDATRVNLPMGGLDEATHLHMGARGGGNSPTRSHDGPTQILPP